jgi:glutaryl-CoA dehydrogenase
MNTVPPFDPYDPLSLDASLSSDEIAVRDTVKKFCAEHVTPYVAEWFEAGDLPVARELAKQFGELGLLGMHLQGYGCGGASAVHYGLACLELEAADSGIRSLVSVQGSLAMCAIANFGSEEQKRQWLPGMAAGELLGCFGLTEPDVGSDPAAMKTQARRVGSDWILNGRKMWITNGSIADVAIVWAATDDGIRGFIVPTDTPGFTANTIHHKLSLRASITSELVLDDVRLPPDAMLPKAIGSQRATGVPVRGALRNHLGSDGRCAVGMAVRTRLCEAAHPVRPTDRRIPVDPGQTRRHGGRTAQGTAAGTAPRPPQGQRRPASRAGQLRQAQQHP